MDKLIAFVKKLLLALERLTLGLEYKVYVNNVLLATVKTRASEVTLRMERGVVRSPGLKPGQVWYPDVRVEPAFQPGGTNVVVRFPPWVEGDGTDLSPFERLAHARA